MTESSAGQLQSGNTRDAQEPDTVNREPAGMPPDGFLSLCCPTRGRPASVDRFVQAARATARWPDRLEFIFAVDDDDAESGQADVLRQPGPNVKVVRVPRQTLSHYWTICARVARGPLYMQAGDDLVPRTDGWDAGFWTAYGALPPDRIGLLFADDGSPTGSGRTFATHGVITQEWLDVLGYFTPPYFSSDFGDTWLNELADSIGRKRRVHSSIIEHLHPLWGKAAWDRTHQERLARHAADHPDLRYAERAEERRCDADRLWAAVERPARQPLWSILIAHLAERGPLLAALLTHLSQGLTQAAGAVEVVIAGDAGEVDIGRKRTALVEAARGHYVSFLDDDDWVPEVYIPAILASLLRERPDYVGFQVQCIWDGVPLKPTYHSLRYTGWWDDAQGYYRDLSHLNPILRGLARLVPFEGRYGEDHRWAQALASTGLCRREVYLDAVLYEYRYAPQRSSRMGGWQASPAVADVIPPHSAIRWLPSPERSA